MNNNTLESHRDSAQKFVKVNKYRSAMKFQPLAKDTD